MRYWMWAALLFPVGAFLFRACICLPIRWLVHKFMRDGKLKDCLLRRRWGNSDSLTR